MPEEELEQEQEQEVTDEPKEEKPEEAEEPKEPLFNQAEVDKMLADARREAEENGYKQSQRVISKKDKEIQKLKQSSNSKIDKVLSFFEEDYSKDEFASDKAKKIRELRTNMSQEDRLVEAKEVMDEINAVANEHKISLDDPAFRYARVFYQNGNFKEAIEEVNEVVGRKQKEVVKEESKLSDEDIKKIKEEAKAEAKKEFLKEYNLDKQDKGGSDFVSSDFDEIRNNYIKNPTDKAAQSAYLKARREKGL